MKSIHANDNQGTYVYENMVKYEKKFFLFFARENP